MCYNLGMSNFSSLETLQQEIRSCRACDLSVTSTQPVLGEGRPKARLFFLAQSPGEQEDQEDRMFVGPSGKIFRELLHISGITWDDCYLTNLVKCWIPHSRQPKKTEIIACNHFLLSELELCQPEILVPLGFYATRCIFDLFKNETLHRDEFSHVIGRFQVSKNHGIYPLSHPASVLYQPELRNSLECSYAKLAVLKQPCKWHHVCPITRFAKLGLIDDYWPRYYCYGDWSSCTRYKMEEEGVFHPDSMMPDGTIDTTLR